MRRLGDKLFDALTAMIERNEIVEGQRLPSETALAERFGVSRPTVRETLARLRDEGLIASRRGSGSYVQALPQDRTAIHTPAFRVVDSFNQIRQCYEFRAAVEGESAFLAATARSEAQLAELRGAIALLDQSISARALGVEADFSFHLLVATASGNSWFVSALQAMRAQIEVSIEIARRLSLHKSDAHLVAVQAEHVAILDAIAGQDGAGAREAMRDHLSSTCNRIFGGS
jgi:GntR family transcriptional repressor for pyruvate dehydrogenase complex